MWRTLALTTCSCYTLQHHFEFDSNPQNVGIVPEPIDLESFSESICESLSAKIDRTWHLAQKTSLFEMKKIGPHLYTA